MTIEKFNIFVLNSIYFIVISLLWFVTYGKKILPKKKEEIKINPYHIHIHQLFGPFISGFLDRITNFSLEYILYIYNICWLLQCLYRILEEKKNKVT